MSLTLPATGGDGTPAVLKLNFPDVESALEADGQQRPATGNLLTD